MVVRLARSAELLALSVGIALWLALLIRPAAPTPAAVYAPRTGSIDPPPPLRAAAPPEGVRTGEFFGTVLGTVTDATGDPVEGVAVFVRPLALTLPPVVGAFITDAWGRFRVTGLAAGRYSIVAIHGGHPPGAVESVPVFPDELATAPTPEPCVDQRPTPSPHDPAGVYWRANGCVEVDIVLDLHNVLDA